MFSLIRAFIGIALVLLMSIALGNVLTLEKYKGMSHKEKIIAIIFSVSVIAIVLWYMVLGGIQ